MLTINKLSKIKLSISVTHNRVFDCWNKYMLVSVQYFYSIFFEFIVNSCSFLILVQEAVVDELHDNIEQSYETLLKVIKIKWNRTFNWNYSKNGKIPN